MNKLIKLSETHYIVVDDSEIKEETYVFRKTDKSIFLALYTDEVSFKNCQPIIYTTPCNNLEYYYQHGVKPLSLSEVEEVIYGYSVENIVKEYVQELIDCKSVRESERTWVSAICHQMFFKAHQELLKDKIIINDNQMMDIMDICVNNRGLFRGEVLDKIKGYLLPKTEWNIEFDEQGKIILL